jgi:hypothetical protein
VSRDLSLSAVAALGVAALAFVATVDPPASDQIITGIVALGAGALGRISGANSGDKP